MPEFVSSNIRLSYLDEGEGDPILLIHGFASNKMINWVYPSWVTALIEAGYRVIAIDNRGHGESEKIYESAAYPATTMAEDAYHLIKHLDLPRCHVMGYSMGARISAFLALRWPDHVRSVVFGGLGINMVHGVGGGAEIIEALLAENVDDIKSATGRAFRKFADQTRSDRRALAACMGASRQKISSEEIATVQVPTLVAVGTEDHIGGSARELAALIPGAEALDIPKRDHMVAVGDRVYKAGVLDFLRRQA